MPKKLTEEDITRIGQQAKAAALNHMATADGKTKDRALNNIAELIDKHRNELQSANEKDVLEAKTKLEDARKNNKKTHLTEAFIDRLELTDKRISDMVAGINEVIKLEDPIGKITPMKEIEVSGIKLAKMTVPLGTVFIMYESRPNVTIDAAALCIKSGNATILRGGSDALNSNLYLAELITKGLEEAGLPGYAVQIIEDTNRELVPLLLKSKDIDVAVPRGGKGLVKTVSENAIMPVIYHLDGICHVYIDDKADPVKAVDIVINSKTQRYGTCNTMECLLLHKDIAGKSLKQIADELVKVVNVQKLKEPFIIYCDAASKEILNEKKYEGIQLKDVTDELYGTEFLAPKMCVKVVENVAAAIDHINTYGSSHTDSIVTEDEDRAELFVRKVDSSSVMVNASTRFADGFQYGFGCEIGISTNKTHARGPVGLEGLTIYKYVVYPGENYVRGGKPQSKL